MTARHLDGFQTRSPREGRLRRILAATVANLSLCIQPLRQSMSIVICLLALSGCAGLQVTAPEHRESGLPALTFNLSHGGQAVYYAFDVGQPSAGDPLIFFISGSGCASVRPRFPAYFAPMNNLPAHVLVLQKRGIGPDSTGNDCSDTFIANDYFERIVEDQRAFIDQQLKIRPSEARAIILMGASEGAMVAAKIASADRRISHLALIGSGGATMRENLRILAKKSWRFSAIEDTFGAVSMEPHSLSKAVHGHSYKYWNSVLDVDLGQLLLPLEIPILIAMGQNDESVPAEMAVKLKEQFDRRGKTNLTVRIFPDADHRLQDRARSKSYAGDFLQEFAALVQATARPPADAGPAK